MVTIEEYKIGDWVIGWHSDYKENYFKINAWQIFKIDGNSNKKYVYPSEDYYCNTGINNIRKAKPHEIPVEFRNILQTIEIW